MDRATIKNRIAESIDDFLKIFWHGKSFDNIFLNNMSEYIVHDCENFFNISDNKYYFKIKSCGEIYDFDKQCNKIDYSDPNYLLVFNSNNSGDRLLAMFPHKLVETVYSISYTNNK